MFPLNRKGVQWFTPERSIGPMHSRFIPIRGEDSYGFGPLTTYHYDYLLITLLNASESP
jgi:hypothetical protein